MIQNTIEIRRIRWRRNRGMSVIEAGAGSPGSFDVAYSHETGSGRLGVGGADQCSEVCHCLAGALGEALSKFMLVVENYPDLKANQNFLAVQEELTSTENKISFARQNYNDQVLFFNNKIQVFPSNMVANMFSFNKRDFFEIESAAEREVPKVSF